MVSLDWCKRQKDGIKLVEPNENLAREYIKNAEETLASLKTDNSNMWKATKKYYVEYLSIYAILMRLGVKCEIHDCTIELIKLLEGVNLLPRATYKILEQDKKLRIDNQYYLKNIDVLINYEELLEFILVIKEKINSLTHEEINNIRKEIEKC